MPSHVGTVIVVGFPQEKEAIVEDLGGQHVSSATDPNFPFKQAKPMCMPILFYPSCLYHVMLANILCTYV
jgi:hypothetical protein